MRLLYNILQIFALPALLFIWAVLLVVKPEKGRMLIQRCGAGLTRFNPSEKSEKVIWIHALSVGETNSVTPLVHALHAGKKPGTRIVFSATTVSGQKLAKTKLSPYVDDIVPFPLDFIPVIAFFLNRIRPDIFILVETDFWPNFLSGLSSRNIPAILVNGRISTRSMKKYQQFSFFFKPMFDNLRLLCMQTASDAENMHHLGITKDKIRVPGNLKYAADETNTSNMRVTLEVSENDLFIICGSTHPGEEEIILEVFSDISGSDDIRLAIAPRNISRSSEIADIASGHGIASVCFSTAPERLPSFLIIDTLGDLASLYKVADIAYIGGSLVPFGGHNPLEASRLGLPAIFGPHMESFSEISSDLLENNGAYQVASRDEFKKTLIELISSPQLRKTVGQNGKACFDRYQHVIKAHLDIISEWM